MRLHEGHDIVVIGDLDLHDLSVTHDQGKRGDIARVKGRDRLVARDLIGARMRAVCGVARLQPERKVMRIVEAQGAPVLRVPHLIHLAHIHLVAARVLRGLRDPVGAVQRVFRLLRAGHQDEKHHRCNQQHGGCRADHDAPDGKALFVILCFMLFQLD